MDWRRFAVQNKQATETKEFGQALDFLISEVRRYQDEAVGQIRLALPSRLRGADRIDFLAKLWPQAERRLGQLSLQDWSVDLAALEQNDRCPNDIGYGNNGNLIRHPFKIGLLLERAVTSGLEVVTELAYAKQGEQISDTEQPLAA